MIKPVEYCDMLKECGIDFFVGVPDSLLKHFCSCVYDNTEANKNIIAANEGCAIGIAAGHYLATGKIALVYMQNAGLGNAVNPLLSLADPTVYGIPILLMVGWRGEPGVKDEPQHIKQGAITPDLLSVMGIKYEILPDSYDRAVEVVKNASAYMLSNNAPFALLVSSNTFEAYKSTREHISKYEMTREDSIRAIVSGLGDRDIVVASTGGISRELFECREAANKEHSNDFLVVGSMGHASQIALGVALSRPDINVYCLDGDGAMIMHMGGLAVIGQHLPHNFRHILINNGAHDSVGGQPTAAFNMDIEKLVMSCSYKYYYAQTIVEVIEKHNLMINNAGPSFLEVRVNRGARNDLGRPTMMPKENMMELMKRVKQVKQ